MASGQERVLKRRIKSVQSTKKITKAMELISASRIAKAQERVAAARPYSERITEADWRLFTTLVRFDPVYHTHFKCNRAWLREYPNLWGWTREMYQWPGVAETVHFDHIVRHYHYSHATINPYRIIPINPIIDWLEPHGREGV